MQEWREIAHDLDLTRWQQLRAKHDHEFESWHRSLRERWSEYQQTHLRKYHIFFCDSADFLLVYAHMFKRSADCFLCKMSERMISSFTFILALSTHSASSTELLQIVNTRVHSHFRSSLLRSRCQSERTCSVVEMSSISLFTSNKWALINAFSRIFKSRKNDSHIHDYQNLKQNHQFLSHPWVWKAA